MWYKSVIPVVGSNYLINHVSHPYSYNCIGSRCHAHNTVSKNQLLQKSSDKISSVREGGVSRHVKSPK